MNAASGHSEARTYASLEAAVDGVIVLGRDGTIEHFGGGAALMFGYSPEDVIGRPLDLLVSPSDAPRPGEPAVRHTATPERGRAGTLRVIEARRKDGSVFPAEISCAAGAVADTEVGRVQVLIVRDLVRSPLYTECQRRSAELARARDELQQFAYVASHDLQEPLRMVTGYLDLLVRRHGDELSGEARRFVDNAVDGADRMRGLLEALLAYSRVSTRGHTFGPVDLAEAADEACVALARAIEAAGAEIQCEQLAGQVWGDRAQIVQLFRHLLANALKYRHAGRPLVVRIGARPASESVEMFVADNGIGIEAKFAEQVFAVFRRLHTRTEYPGTGIGLAICKRIVERHGGRICLDTSRTQGARFWVTLPGSKGNVDA